MEQISTLADCCLQNASELVEEARLLFMRKRYARALFLSVVALEETSKRDILWQAILIRDDEKEWKKFWEKLRSHKTKLATMLRDHISINDSMDKTTPRERIHEYMKEFVRVETDAGFIDLVKQWSLYVDMVDNKPILPSWKFNKEYVSKTIKLAEQHLEYHRRFKPTNEELETHLNLKKKMKKGETFIDYWYRTHGYLEREKDS